MRGNIDSTCQYQLDKKVQKYYKIEIVSNDTSVTKTYFSNAFFVATYGMSGLVSKPGMKGTFIVKMLHNNEIRKITYTEAWNQLFR